MRKREKLPVKKARKPVKARATKKQKPSPSKATAAKKPRGRPRLDDTPVPPAPPPQPPAEEKPPLMETLLLRLVSPLKSLPVQTPEAVVYIRPEDIAFVKTTEARRIIIYDVNGDEWQRFDLLSDLEKRLQGDPRFFRPHKSFLVNIFAVKKLRKNPTTGLFELYFGDKVKGFAQAASGNMRELRQRLEL